MNIGYAFLVVIVGMAYFVSGVPTPDEMQAEFSAAQKFYASKAYDQSLEKYDQVFKMQSRFLDDEKVIAEYGNLRCPIKDLTLYQSGNSYFQMAKDQKSSETTAKTDSDKEKAKKLALEYVQKASDYFTKTQDRSKVDELRAQSQNRVIETWYLINDHERVIQEGNKLIQNYPNSSYVLNAMYNIGWAYYDTKKYDQSIDAFTRLLTRFPSGNLPDRALFQVGEAYFDQKKFAEAIPYYQRLVDKMRINEMTDQEIQKIQRQKLAGLADQTALDLAAKAQLKIGASYAEVGDFKQAEAAYKRVAVLFRFDKNLISEAYRRLADMYFAKGDLESSIQAYRDAIDEVNDKIFQAKMQVEIAKRYFDNFIFDKSLTEFTNYINIYNDVALRAGFDLDKAFYYQARSFYENGSTLLRKKETQLGQDSIAQSIKTYERILKDYPESDLKAVVYYNLGLAYQKTGTPEFIQKAIDEYNLLMKEFPETPYRLGCYYQTAVGLQEMKKFDEAIGLYTKIIQEFPKDEYIHNAWFQLARCYKDAGRENEAVDPFLKVSRKDKTLFTTARLFAAQTLIKESKFQEALDAMKYAVEDTGAVDGVYRLSQFYIMMGSACRSIAEAQKDSTKLNDALTYYNKSYDLNVPETREQTSVYRATVLIDLGQYNRAESDLKELMNSTDPKIKRDAQMRLAMISVRQQKSAQAIDTYLGLYNSTQDPVEKLGFLRNLMQISFQAQDNANLTKFAAMMINSDIAEGKKPENSEFYYKEEAYYYLGIFAENQSDYKKAVEYYSDGYKKFPNSVYSSDMLIKVAAMYLTKLNTEKDALDISGDYFNQYIKAFPNTAMTEMAHYYLGFCYYNGRRFPEALNAFKSFSDRYPNSEFTAEAIYYYSDCNYNLGNYSESVNGFNAVITKYPNHEKAEEALFTKAWALLDLQREDEAMATLRQMVDKYPKSRFAAQSLFSIADSYYNAQKYEDALNTYQEVLKKYPESDVAKKIPDTINELKETVAYVEYEKAYEPFGKAREGKADPATVMGWYRQAATGFEAVILKYPGTESETGALSNVGITYEELGEWQKAADAFDKVMKKFESTGAVTQEAFTFAKAHKDYIVANKL
ncbi:MAG: tetratricopeptide repeat protein [Candidatus Latescibacter sp.]|nr:tetratricopeptide repeat protein [Candidatus Latescibacter sp.]